MEPPLRLLDELTVAAVLGLADGAAGADVLARMAELGRPGRAGGAGFYDYADGRATNRPTTDEDLGLPAKPAEAAPGGSTAPPSDATPAPAPAPGAAATRVPTPAP